MINVYFKQGLATIDIRLQQLRLVKGKAEDLKPIAFINLGRDATECYVFLHNEDKELFYNSLKEDIYSYTGEHWTLVEESKK
jgi:hypothetical protein